MDSAAVVDEDYRLLLVGGMPLFIVHLDTGQRVAALELGGTLRSGHVRGLYIHLLVQPANTTTVRVVRLRRAAVPALIAEALPVQAQSRGGRRRREWQAQAVATAYTKVFSAGGEQFAVIFQNGALTVTALHNGTGNRTGVRDVRLPAVVLGLDAVRTAAVWCGRDCAAAALLVGGAWRGRWRVAAVDLWSLGAVHNVSAAVPHCLPAAPCQAVGSLAVAGDVLYVALEHGAGLVLAALDLGPGPGTGPPAVLRGAALAGVPGGSLATGLVVDGPTQNLFLATHVTGAPSVIYKLAAASFAPRGAIRLGVCGRPRSRGSVVTARGT